MKHGENAGTYSVSWKAGERWVDHLGRVWPLPSPTQRLQFRVRAHAALRAFVYHRDGYRCQRCGVVAEVPDGYDGRFSIYRPVTFVLDHVVSLRNGGTTHPDNLQTLCDPCNAGKAGRVDAKGVTPP